MKSMDTLDIASVVVLIFNVLVICPVCAYYLVLFRKYDKLRELHPVIAHRNPLLVYVINILVIFTNLSERVYMSQARIWSVEKVPEWSVVLFMALMWWAVMTLFAIKCYHLYFVQQYNLAMAEASWRNDINPKETNWFIANKASFGNPRYLMRIAVFPYLMAVALDVFIAVMMQRIGYRMANFVLASLPLAFIVYIFCRTRHVNDIYGVRNEIAYQFCVLFSSLFILTVSFVVCNYVVERTPDVVRIEWFISILVTDGITVALALLSTLYPITLIRKRGLDNEVRSNSVSNVRAACNPNALLAVLADYTSFKVFMKYLVSAFCAENLLFIIELTQVKHHHQLKQNGIVRAPKDSFSVLRSLLRSDRKATAQSKASASWTELSAASYDSSVITANNELTQTIDFNAKTVDAFADRATIFTYLFNEDGRIMTPIFLPSTLPNTVAISEKNATLHAQMAFLYRKYIKVGSEREVNISWAMRDSLTAYFERGIADSDFGVFNLLDGIALETLCLLHRTFARFVHSTEYERLIAESPKFCNPPKMVETHELNSAETPVLRNADSYSTMQQHYSFTSTY